MDRFQYTGQAWLPELGMYSYKARVYSATLGRFLQTDPAGYPDGPNWYAYAMNDPVNNRDPSGRCSNDACAIVVTAPGGGGGWSGSLSDSFGAAQAAFMQAYINYVNSVVTLQFRQIEGGRQNTRPCSGVQKAAEWVGDRSGTAATGTARIAAGLSAVGALTAPVPLLQGVSAGAFTLAADFGAASAIFGTTTTIANLVAGQPAAVAIEKGVGVSVGALLPGAGKYAKDVISDTISTDIQGELARCAR